MKERIFRRIITAALCAALFTLGGSAGLAATGRDVISGGTTDRTDPDAPKEIASKDIAEFDAAFCVVTRWTSEEGNFFHFRIAEGEDGALTASEEYLGIGLHADAELLAALQEIVDRFGLAEMNGVYRVTAGLAPEYQEGALKIRYASGEELEFTINNDPYAEWAEAMYDAFAAWFAEKGENALYPVRETSPVEELRLMFLEGDAYLFYDTVGSDGGERRLYREVSDADGDAEAYAPLPEDFGARLAQIFDSCELVRRYDFSEYNRDAGNYSMHEEGYFGMGGMGPGDGEEDSEGSALTLHVTYESGNRVYIDTKKPSEIEGMRGMLAELAEYCDSLF